MSQRSLHAICLGLFCTLNFVSLFSLAQKVPSLLSETEESRTASHPYDWRLGIIQYCVGLPIAFMGLVSLEGSALSVLSKLSPPRFRGVAVNTGTYVVFVGFLARLIGDFQLYFVVLSHRLINTDIVNAGKRIIASRFFARYKASHFRFVLSCNSTITSWYTDSIGR